MRQQLAQRLYPRDALSKRNRVIIRNSSIPSLERPEPLQPLAPKLALNTRSSKTHRKPSKLEPLSPYIINKLNSPLPSQRALLSVPSSIQESDLLSSLKLDKFDSKLTHRSPFVTKRPKKKYTHGDALTENEAIQASLQGKTQTPYDFIQVIKNDPELRDDFWYCNRKGDAYDFEFVSFKDKNPDEYLTISSRGVTHFNKGDAVFLSLAEWEREYKVYQKVKEIKFFKGYKLWKNFSIWKNSRRRNMMQDRAKYLETELFVLDEMLRDPLLNVRQMSYKITKFDLVDLNLDTVRTLEHFNQDQEKRREGIAEELQELEGTIVSLVKHSCNCSMEAFRRENNTTVNDEEGTKEGDEEANPFLVGDSSNKQMPYTQEAIIRTHYKRLSRFIRLCDYQIIDAKIFLSHATVNKVVKSIITDYSEPMQSKNNNKKQQALLKIFCDFDRIEVLFKPDSEKVGIAMDDAFMRSLTMLLNNYLLINAPDFEKYTKANEEFDEKSFEDDIDLLQMVINDKEIQQKEKDLKKGVQDAFEAVKRHCEIFYKSLEIYDENRSFTEEVYRDADAEDIKQALIKFKSQQEEFEKMKDIFDLGIFQLNAKAIKQKLLPSPIKCREQIEKLLPEISLEKSKRLIIDLNEAHANINSIPMNVDDYIRLNKYLKEIEDNMQGYTQRYNDVKDLLQLMEIYCIRNPESNRLKFQETLQTLNKLRLRVASYYERAESDKVRFGRELRENILTLDKKVIELKIKLADERLMDRDSVTISMVNLLSEAGKEVESLYKQSQSYNHYLEAMELEKRNFNEVYELKQDFKLKNDMWTAMHEWQFKVAQWNETPFNVIDVEEISKEVDRCYRVAQRSKALEEQGNYVPEVLKAKVDSLKDTMPVVVDLRSKFLKDRHWKLICEVLDTQIDIEDETFTLKNLLDMKVNDKREQIADIALRARKEEEIEKALNDLVLSWDGVEFQFKYDKDKEYYTFTEIEDIQTKLEDTHVMLTTLISNRFVGPLFEKVDYWSKKFALFSNTFEEWLLCQKQWAELEKIFTTGDIAKQMHDKAKKFNQIHTAFKELMRMTAERPEALPAATREGLIKDLQDWNKRLEKLQKDLEEYLDRKRKLFTRFFFLSNDELLTILSNSQRPRLIQPHLKNMFEAIYKIIFSDTKGDDILAMVSAEGETVHLGKNLRARGNVEEWLELLEHDMKNTLKKEMKKGYQKYNLKPRRDWVIKPAAQVVATVGMIMWCFGTEEALTSRDSIQDAIADWYETNVAQLEELTQLVREDLPLVKRRSIVALVTQDVHNRDIIETLRDEEVSSISDFKWQQQLRYYWDTEKDDIVIRQVNALFDYGYEYMGATTRLVITPLTDRCWMTITGALSIKLGAAPAGPAGTGKTESTKDLAKAMGCYCVVFNCSEQVTFQMTEKLFMGLCSTGAWTCLDEFNRIDIEVLSVIASQLRCIRKAKLEEKAEFYFEDKICKLIPTMGVFITMNPGYAGRTELPDNLKVLFRPVSMMVPDYTLIAEIMLFAEGFSYAKQLSGKMTKLYKLSSEQLSQQDHYDFGMRAVKSVLNMAGTLKRKEPHLPEEEVLIRAMREANTPKFLKDDLVLFEAIVKDLFPNVKITPVDYGELETSIRECITKEQLQPVPGFIHKVIQLYETFSVRFGVMIVGPATSGKTTCYNILAQAVTSLRQNNSRNENFQKVVFQVINPKAITKGELYGEFNELTQDWKDGIASNIMREYAKLEEATRRWVVFDGPVDSLWIEDMNSVLDDSMMLCLGNSERIKLKPEMRILFEVLDLAVASPATVSRCGMVYMNIETVGWKPYVETWMKRNLKDWPVPMYEHLWLLFCTYIENTLKFIRRSLSEPIPTMDNSLIASLCNLIKALTQDSPRLVDEIDYAKKYVDKIFVFALTWSLGGALDHSSSIKFDAHLSSDLQCELPQKSLYDFWVNSTQKSGLYRPWDDIKPDFIYNPDLSFYEMLVPTKDTVRFANLLKLSVSIKRPIFITGYTGVGKSVIINNTLQEMKLNDNIYPLFITFSAQTSSSQTQNSIISKLDSKRKDLFGGPGTKKVVLFIDDINMPLVEKYGAQPPIELMRQFCDCSYFYDRSKHFKLKIIDTTLVCSAAPPEGGRYPLTTRFTRHFHMVCVPPTSEESMDIIFKSILEGFLTNGFRPEIQALINPIMSSTKVIYQTICKELLPTPAKSHYSFNLRDMSKVFQGLLMARSKVFSSPDAMIKLWVHETCRVFYDRLINNEDKRWFSELVVKMLVQYFRKTVTHEEIFEGWPIIFVDFIKGNLDVEDRDYEEAPDSNLLLKRVNEFLGDYNLENAGQLNLVFFQDALQHLCRITRILRLQRGNAMLVGVGGCGKQSLTKLASYMSHCKCFMISVTKDYKSAQFREDLKALYIQSGGQEAKPTVFLLTDTQIVQESFLEDINNILNSGEVPNLFSKEEIEQIDMELRPIAESKKVYDNIFNFFIQRVRGNLHVVLCMSPIGDALRVRMRMFPSLVNCCTIDWVNPWPEDALLSVSRNKLSEINLPDMDKNDQVRMKEAIAAMCVNVHVSVDEISQEFYQVLGRRVYITPKSYLDMIGCYYKLLNEKREELTKNRYRYASGVQQLEKTNKDVIVMRENLTQLAPVLEKKKIEAEELAKKVEADSIEANKVKEVAEEEERAVTLQTQEIQKLREEAESDLNEAMPALEASTRALDNINSKDIAEIRTFPSPPALVSYTLEAIAILMEQKTEWDNIKRIMQNNFIDNLKHFPRDSIKPNTLRKLRQKINANPNFTPDKVGSVNNASRSLCEWVFAMENYAKISKEVEPKRLHLEKMNHILQDAQQNLKATQDKLQIELDKVAKLEAQLTEVMEEMEKLDRQSKKTKIRLERSSVLTEGLVEEHKRWEIKVGQLTSQIRNVLGDVFISSACISYYGPFSGSYRNRLLDIWLSKCSELKIPVSENYDLQTVMGDPLIIREWSLAGLPSDAVSVNNGILVTKSERWPLMIDPQEQANRWIKKMEEKRNLKICKQTDKDFVFQLKNCIRNGIPMLIEDVGETLSPSLDPVLHKNIKPQGLNSFLIKMGESDEDYDMNFTLYMTTKMSNPHYLPDIAIKVTLINFTVTTLGLEEQLLADVVNREEPEIERQKVQILMTIASYQKKLKEIEDSILKSLSETQGHILDNAQLIENLKSSKKVSEEISIRMISSEETKKKIEEARAKYKTVSMRGSILYFVVADLANIDPMYQFSLAYFTRLFNYIIENSERAKTLEERLDILMRNITSIIYQNVSRGLFNSHKLIFSFLIAVQIMRNDKMINDAEWSLLLRGVSIIPSEFKKVTNPDSHNISDKAWDFVTYLQNISPPFKERLLGEEIRKDLSSWLAWIHTKEPQNEPLPGRYLGISSFHKLLLIKSFREEKVIYSIIKCVEERMGLDYVQVKPISMDTVFSETNSKTPVIFILSQGADPTSMIQRLAKDQNFTDKLEIISLGKGQGERAKKCIEKSMRDGKWVLLQNCHLAKSWMPELERMIDSFEDPKTKISDDFRLYLTSMPCNYFPAPILQNGVKITNEPPKGIKSNVMRSLNSLTEEQYESSAKPQELKKLLISLSFFHAVVQERRKFGPLGWNIKYEFNESDLETSITVLSNFLEEPSIPWDALYFVTGDINYGGRVTDDWDRRCLKAILSNFIHPNVLTPEFKFSNSGVYHIPKDLRLNKVKEYVNTLPIADEPEIFGMHENANITFQNQESASILEIALSIQPREKGSTGTGKSSDQLADEMAAAILESLPSTLLKNEAGSTTFVPEANGLLDAMATFLLQEMERFNKLLRVMRRSLQEIRKAIKGLVIMSNDLDMMYQAILNNAVPSLWRDAGYPSLKPLAAWFHDLKERVNFLRKWLANGRPEAYWLSSFFFPQGFLTAVLQSYARKYGVPIDTLNFSFEFQNFADIESIEDQPDEGVFIYGLFMEGCRWGNESMQLEDPIPGEMYSQSPIILFEPADNHIAEQDDYLMPVYKTSVRAGVLSTTGHSTNFIIAIECPTTRSPKYWVLKGAAFLCQLND
jgi:dynein heavy chain